MEYDPEIDARIWAQSDDDDDYKPLYIDEILAEPFVRSNLRCSLQEAKRLVRRTIEVAYMEILRVNKESPGPIADDFQRRADGAGNAAEAIDRFLKGLDPRAKAATDLELPILTMQAGLQEATSAYELHKEARNEALILWKASEILRRLEKAATSRKARARDGRQNPGKPEHRIFAEVFAEAWIFLVGKRPGTKNRRYDKNPFLRLTAAAWHDVFGPGNKDAPTLFTGALKYIAKWSDPKVAKLRSKGPNWL